MAATSPSTIDCVSIAAFRPHVAETPRIARSGNSNCKPHVLTGWLSPAFGAFSATTAPVTPFQFDPPGHDRKPGLFQRLARSKDRKRYPFWVITSGKKLSDESGDNLSITSPDAAGEPLCCQDVGPTIMKSLNHQ